MFIIIGRNVFLGSFAFAQLQKIKIPTDLQIHNQTKDNRVGNINLLYNVTFDSGNEFAILPKVVNPSLAAVGNVLTKVKFFADVTQLGTTNKSYPIRIYENATFDPATQDHADSTGCGTSVYTQEYTATDDGDQVVELTTPYIIINNNFWVSIKCNGKSAVFFGDTDESTLGQYAYSFVSGSDGKIWVPSQLIDSNNNVTTNPIYLSVFTASSDIQAGFMSSNTPPYTNADANQMMGANDDWVIWPYIYNDGPDNTTDSVLIELTVNDDILISSNKVELVTMFSVGALQTGYFSFFMRQGQWYEIN